MVNRNLKFALEISEKGAKLTAREISKLQARIERASASAGDLSVDVAGGFGSVIESVTGVANSINEIAGAGEMLIAGLGGAYEFLIGSNETLNQQLLASQSNIAAVADIKVNGDAITEPTEKILATQDKLKVALKDLEIKTQDLVGVTDADVQGVFQTLLQNTAALTGQSEEFGNAISASTELSAGLVATLGTLGVPMEQAASEIGDLIKGQITSDSIVAKSLGITNAMVNDWKSQNILVDELNKKFDVFKAGNALAANSIAGVTSNIQSFVEDIGRQVGGDLLGPLVAQLQEVYTFLVDNKDTFLEFGFEGIEQAKDTIGAIVEELKGAIAQLDLEAGLEIGLDQLTNILDVVESVGVSLIKVGAALAPIVVGMLKAGQEAGPVIADVFEGLEAVVTGLVPVVKVLANIIGGTLAAAGKGVTVVYEAIESRVGFLTGSINQSREAVEAYERSLQVLYNESAQRNSKLKAALEARQKAEAQGMKLTEEQLKAEKAARTSAEATIAALEAQKKELDEAAISGKENREAIEDQKAALDAQIKGLEEGVESLSDYGDELEIAAKRAEELGAATDQFAQKATTALDKLASGTGTTEELEEAAKTLQDTTQQQLELGQVTTEKAIENLQAIATNTQLSAEQQLDAEKEITALKEQELKNRQEDYKLAQADLEADIEAGRVNEIEGEKQLTQSRINALDEEIELRKARIEELNELGRGDSQEAKETLRNVKELEQEKEAIAIESIEKLSKLRLEKLEEEQEKSLQLIELAETKRNNTIKELRLEGLAGSKEENEAQLQDTRDRIKEELKLTKERSRVELAERRKVFEASLEFATTDEERAELEKKFAKETEEFKREQALETAELEGELLQNELDAEAEAREQILRAAEAQAANIELALNQRLSQNDAIADSLQRQRDLMGQQSALLEAQNALQQSLAQGRIEGLERALGAAQDLAQFEQDGKDAQEGKVDAEKAAQDAQAESLRLAIDQNNVTSERELLLQNLIEQEVEGSDRRLTLERELAAEQRQKAQTQLTLEKELAKVTGEQSRVIQAQLALAKDGSQEKLALEKQLLEELAKEERAAFQEQIEEAKKQEEESRRQAEEAQKQKEIAAAQELQRAEELKALGLDRNASELEIIKAKQAEEDKAAALDREIRKEKLIADQRELEFNIQNQRIEAERLILDREAAAIAAQQALLEAQMAAAADPTNELLKVQVALAQQNVELSEQQRVKAQEQLVQQEAAADQQREILALQQEQEVRQAQQDELNRGLDQARELAALGEKNATELAQQGNASPKEFAVPKAAALPDFGSAIADLPELTLNLPEIPELQVSQDNPLNQGLEKVREDIKAATAAILNQPPPQVSVTANTPKPSGPRGGGFGTAAVNAVGLG